MSKVILQKIQLENFKCYQKTTILFKDLTVIVGQNNAGKSCLIEALRLVAKAAQYAKRKTYISAPKEFDLPLNIKGFKIDTQKLKIDLNLIIYYYVSAKFAKVTAFFCNKSKIEIYLNNSNAFAVVYDDIGQVVKKQSQIADFDFNTICILPQIGPIRVDEKFLSPETVVGDKDTYLSSLHFRNEIYLWKDIYFAEFKRIAEDTWKGLEIAPMEANPYRDDFINLMVKDDNFTAEIGKMGSGLQMWLQIVWFLARSKDCSIIILDEPDVYMHSDMQRKILELVKLKFPQVIIATHSLEIITRVPPENILEINKKDKKMHYASDYRTAQKIIDDIGGVQNLSLLNLGRQRRCLFVEGKDFHYLNLLNEKMLGRQLYIPSFEYGGFSNIPQLYGASQMFYDETDNNIKCYALADKDYRDERVVQKYLDEAQEKHLILHIWSRKEIENYFIVPEVLFSYIPKEFGLDYEQFLSELDDLLEHEKDSVFDAYANQYRVDSKFLSSGEQWDVSRCNREARIYFNSHWQTLDDKISLVNGKSFIKKIRNQFQTKYGVDVTITKILNSFDKDNIPKEMQEFLMLLNE